MVGPHDEIIMKHVWEVVIQPGWEISMHMWPIPEPPPEGELVDELANIMIVDEGAPPPPPPAPKAPKKRPGDGAGVFSKWYGCYIILICADKKVKKKKEKVSPFMIWTAGKSKKKGGKAKK